MLMWDSKSQALEYQSLKVARGIGAVAMEDVLRLSRESMKFKYQERSQLYKALESDDKSIPDKQVKANFEDVSTLDVRSYEPKIFTTFEQECREQLHIKNYIEYSGAHSQGDKSGFGCELTPNGDFYCGGWTKGLRHGSGICFYKDGTVYKGSWSDGRWCIGGSSGIGMYKNLQGEIIVGTFTGERGTIKDLTWAQIKYLNGDIYSGMMMKSKK